MQFNLVFNTVHSERSEESVNVCCGELYQNTVSVILNVVKNL